MTWSDAVPADFGNTLHCLDPSLLSLPHLEENGGDDGVSHYLSNYYDNPPNDVSKIFSAAHHPSIEVPEFENVCLLEAASPQANLRRRARGLVRSSSSDSKLSNTSRRSKKRRMTRFTKQQRDVLNSWLIQNRHHPYPTLTEKAELVSNTGLSKRQVEVWYSNARKRYEKVRGPLPFTGQNGQFTHDGQTPLERYLSSSEDEEPAHPDAITRALAKSALSSSHEVPSGNHAPTTPLLTPTTIGPYSPYHQSNAHECEASCGICRNHHFSPTYFPQDGVEASATDDNSLEYAWHETESRLPKNTSMSSMTSAASFGSRQGRRRHGFHSPAFGQELHRPHSEPYMAGLSNSLLHSCSMCSKSFKSASDRRRHENSVHSGNEQWVCKLHEVEPPPALRDHAGDALWWRCTHISEEKRTFYRKDKLRQHLRNTHRLDRACVQGLPLQDWVQGRYRTSTTYSQQDNGITSSFQPFSVKTSSPAEFDNCHGDSLDLHPGRAFCSQSLAAVTAATIRQPITPTKPAVVFTLGGSSGEDDESLSEDLNPPVSGPYNLSNGGLSTRRAGFQVFFSNEQATGPVEDIANEKSSAKKTNDNSINVRLNDEDNGLGVQRRAARWN